jgi:hypothetical protein
MENFKQNYGKLIAASVLFSLAGCSLAPYVPPSTGSTARLRVVDASPNKDTVVLVMRENISCFTPSDGERLAFFGKALGIKPPSMSNLDMPLPEKNRVNTEITISAGAPFGVCVQTSVGTRRSCGKGVQFDPIENADYVVEVANLWTDCSIKLARVVKDADGVGYKKQEVISRTFFSEVR